MWSFAAWTASLATICNSLRRYTAIADDQSRSVAKAIYRMYAKPLKSASPTA